MPAAIASKALLHPFARDGIVRLGACLAFQCWMPKPTARDLTSFSVGVPGSSLSVASLRCSHKRCMSFSRGGQQVRGFRNCVASHAQESSDPGPTFAPHLEQNTIVNPFPGMPTLEAAIGRTVTARIGSNECIPMGSEHPLSAYLPEELVDLARLYPDPYARKIRAQLATLSQVPLEELLIDAGADSLISLTLRTRVLPGDKVITTAGTYPTVVYFAKGMGADVVEVPYKDDGNLIIPDLEALAKSAKENSAAVVYLANPDNPTGHVFTPSEVAAFRESLPQSCVLILDEAYIDFCPEQGVSKRMPNTVQLRTLSKAYGLAGLRVGYAIADKRWIHKADQVRVQFTMNSISNFLVEHVLNDASFSSTLISRTKQLRDELSSKLAAGTGSPLPSSTNFVTVRYANAEDATARQKELWKSGTAVHRPPHPAMGHVLRITASPEALEPHVIAALTQ